MSTSEDESYIPSGSGVEDNCDEEEGEETINQRNYSDDSLLNGYSSVEEDRILTDNFNHLFETQQTFVTRDAAVEWLQEIGDLNNMYLVISTTRPNFRAYIKCHRGNKPRLTATKKGAKSRDTDGSARINCPFQLSVDFNRATRQWRVRTMGDKYGRHNHELGENKEGYRRPSAIKPHEYEMIRIDTALGISPVQCLERLKSQEEPNYSTRQHVYNARAKLKKEKMVGNSPLNMFFLQLIENGWYESHQIIEGTRQVGNIFFGDSKSIKLCEQFSEVLLIDATYKTNIWKLPFAEIVGFVPTGQTYHVGFAFMRDETEVSYTWVMRQLMNILVDFPKPRIFVTDRELALMNAIKKVFPEAENFLCRRHIATDVHQNLTKIMKSKEREKDLSGCWNSIVYAETEPEYESAVLNLAEEFEKCPSFVSYVKKTWLTKYHEKFVACWVDKHLHFGTVTTNRVESAHAQLKNELHSSQDNLNIVWEALNRVVSRQLDTIKGAFEKARSKVNPYAKGTVFVRCPGKVAPKAIKMMMAQIGNAEERYNEVCDCTLWTSHGLPCKCKILEAHAKETPIDPVDIDPFWRSLHMDGTNKPSREERRATAEELLDESVRLYRERHDEMDMRKLASRLRRESHPEFEDYENPSTPPRKGRPPKAKGNRTKSYWEMGYKGIKKKINKTKERASKTKKNQTGSTPDIDLTWHPVPDEIRQFHLPTQVANLVIAWHNVIGDGQCGFRALSWLFYLGNEHLYVDIRLHLQQEMLDNYGFWEAHFELDIHGEFQRIYHALDYMEEGRCTLDHQFQAHEMMQLAAQKFNKVIVVLCRDQAMTYLPILHEYDTDSVIQPALPELPEIWYMGFSDNPGHFYVLDAPPDMPKPCLHPQWTRYCADHIRDWSRQLNMYDERYSRYYD